MNDHQELKFSVPNLSATDEAAAAAMTIATMLELIQGTDERNAIASSVSKLSDLMGRFGAIGADGTAAEVEDLNLELFELLCQHPPLRYLHLGASICEGVRILQGQISIVEERQRAGTATASEVADMPELRRKLSELEREMRQDLDTFETGIRGGDHDRGPK